MNTPQTPLTPEAAAAALASASSTPAPTSPHDRRVYAVGTALSGILLGGYLGFMRGIDSRNPWFDGAVVLYIVLVAAIALWQRRAARSVPRGAKRIGWIGLGATLAVVMVGVGLLNVAYGRTGAPWPMAAALALASAAPLLVAAYVIGRSGRE